MRYQSDFQPPFRWHFLDESLVRSAAAAKQVLLQQSIEAQDNVARRATYRQWSENAEAQ
jgi:hypothetical protein